MNFDCRQAIKEKIEFKADPEGVTPQLNIAWGVDQNFMFGAAISMTSILISNQDICTHFHLFTDYIDDDYRKRFSLLAEKYSTTITVYLMNSEELKVLPHGNAWSHAMYFRFVAFEYLSSEIDTLLYIDADVICKGSLNDLLHVKFNQHVAAVIQDVDDSPARRPGTSQYHEKYFNSGVIYANLHEWKTQQFINKAFALLLENKETLSFPDQDVLNIIFRDKVIFLPRIYNAIYGIKQELKSKNTEAYKKYITSETILIHYVGVTKPWNSWANYPSAQYFTSVWQASPWSDIPLLGARTPKQFKKKSRHERLQGKLFPSIISYLGYLNAKLKNK
jgi:UDP-glucose/galactose:(glucosyl)LPS alpha-1,2-glucosyl/galactosyltransferase/UDP-glucose:(galactosyl)LPS alpha-1,2-glucosyltransferase/(galactosyl)LPS 1,2-glucosyltransferase